MPPSTTSEPELAEIAVSTLPPIKEEEGDLAVPDTPPSNASPDLGQLDLELDNAKFESSLSSSPSYEPALGEFDDKVAESLSENEPDEDKSELSLESSIRSQRI
jgi:hypothetical protein